MDRRRVDTRACRSLPECGLQSAAGWAGEQRPASLEADCRPHSGKPSPPGLFPNPNAWSRTMAGHLHLHRLVSALFVIVVLLPSLVSARPAEPMTLTIHADRPGPSVSPTLYG